MKIKFFDVSTDSAGDVHDSDEGEALTVETTDSGTIYFDTDDGVIVELSRRGVAKLIAWLKENTDQEEVPATEWEEILE